MKKLFIIIMVFIILLPGCKDSDISNIIEKGNLSEEDKKDLKIEEIHENSNIYNYKFNKKYKSVEIWLEVYKKGKLLKERNRAYSKIKDNQGKIYIGVDFDEKYSWLISHQNSNDIMKYSFKTDDEFLKENAYKKNIYSIRKKEYIGSKKILLKAYLFSEENIYINNNEKLENNLKKFNYAYLLKIKFNK